jgi:putative addiction module component (TIGR02574 family)
LNIEEQINFKQKIWDGIAAEQACSELTEMQKLELDRRIADDEANPDNAMIWEEIMASIKEQ